MSFFGFHPLIERWFYDRFEAPTEPQTLGWPHIAAGENTLIAAPTGSGKTLTAFLSVIDRLLKESIDGQLNEQGMRVVYVSPLRALSNDMHRNLSVPLEELNALAAEEFPGVPIARLRAGLRTGDTTSSQRAALVRKPPHILVTTPESLFLLLTAERGREALKTVDTVIVDEIHALVRDKRGSHLALSLERLEEHVGRPLQRIGLSATQKPIERVADFLTGVRGAEVEVRRVMDDERARKDAKTQRENDDSDLCDFASLRETSTSVPSPLGGEGARRAGEGAVQTGVGMPTSDSEAPSSGLRPPSPPRGEGTGSCSIVDVGHSRALDLEIVVPPSELSAVCSNEQWAEVSERIVELINTHRSTLIFVNTRRLAERLTHWLSGILGEEHVSSHHGSIASDRRLDTEYRLKTGQLKAVVATASLELGLDVGFIDLVIQVGSPRSIATFLQRIGRSGHSLGKTPKGRLLALTRDELVECMALIRAVRAGRLDYIPIPENPVDVLAQQIVAEVACREWGTDELFDVCRRAWPYRNLSRKDFDETLHFLSEGLTDRAGRARVYLHHDMVQRRVRSRPGARIVATSNAGAIPETGLFRVVTEDGTVVGTLDEDFAIECHSGQIFLLGNTSWRIQHVRGMDVTVTDAGGAPPTIPFWRGEAPGRTRELSEEISRLRGEIEEKVKAVPETVVATWWDADSVPSPLGGEGARRAGEGAVQTGVGVPTPDPQAPSSGLRPPSPPRGEGTAVALPRSNSPLKKGSDPLEGVEKQGKTGRPERVRPLFQWAANPAPTPVEWCHRRLLARIHRLTMDGLRRQIQPVTPDVFLRFLTEHHGLAKNSQRAGSDGLFEVISILQGIDLAASSWEESILPSRVRGYRPEWLDELCLTGEVGWGRLFPPKKEREAPASLSKIVPVSIFLRSDAEWLTARSVPSPLGGEGGRRPDEGASGSRIGVPTPDRGSPSPALRAPSPPRGEGTEDLADPQGVSEAARRVAVVLASDGAMFATDLMAQCELARGELNQALGELIALGVVTADGFGGLRDLSGGRKATRSGAVLKPGLVRQRHSAGGTGRWTLTELGARSVVAANQIVVPSPLRGEGARSAGEGAVQPGVGVPTPDPQAPSSGLRPPSPPRGEGTALKANDREDAVEQWAWQLLRRWGVVFRDLLIRESGAPRWWELLQVYRRLEARGEIRGGRFISGVAGEQFGLGETVRKLRQLRDEASRPTTRTRSLRHSFLDTMRSGEPDVDETSGSNDDRDGQSAFRVVALPGGVVEEGSPVDRRPNEHTPATRKPEWLVLSAADPLNLVGIVTSHPRVPSAAHNRIVLLDGRPVAAVQNGELVMLEELPPPQLRELQRVTGHNLSPEILPPVPAQGLEPESPQAESDESGPGPDESPPRGRRRFRPVIS